MSKVNQELIDLNTKCITQAMGYIDGGILLLNEVSSKSPLDRAVEIRDKLKYLYLELNKLKTDNSDLSILIQDNP